MPVVPVDRRLFLQASTAALAGAGLAPAGGKKKLTRFQIACMTLPYSRFPLERALKGIKGAGYRYVAWGTSHREGGKSVPVMPGDAGPERARQLGKQCRDMGLAPVLMFSGDYTEEEDALDVLPR